MTRHCDAGQDIRPEEQEQKHESAEICATGHQTSQSAEAEREADRAGQNEEGAREGEARGARADHEARAGCAQSWQRLEID